MAPQHIRTEKKMKVCDANVDMLIERISKMRALNGNPSDVGIDSFVWKRFSSGIPHFVVKF